MTKEISDALCFKNEENFIIIIERSSSYFSTRRFPGYSREGKKFDAEVHRQHIFGLHVANYMKSLKEDNPDLYAKQFSRFVKAGIEPSSVSFNLELHSIDQCSSLSLNSSKRCTKQHIKRFVLIHRPHTVTLTITLNRNGKATFLCIVQ